MLNESPSFHVLDHEASADLESTNGADGRGPSIFVRVIDCRLILAYTSSLPEKYGLLVIVYENERAKHFM